MTYVDCLGPMVYSAFFCDDDQLTVLNDLGCAGNSLTTIIGKKRILH
jgi:hypothetical protein